MGGKLQKRKMWLIDNRIVYIYIYTYIYILSGGNETRRRGETMKQCKRALFFLGKGGRAGGKGM